MFSGLFLRISLPQNMKTVAALIIRQWIVSVARNVLNNSRVLKLLAGAPEARLKMLRQPPSFLDTTRCNDPLALNEQVPMLVKLSWYICEPCTHQKKEHNNVTIYNMIYVIDASAMLKTCCKSPTRYTCKPPPSAKPEWMKCYCHCWVGSWKTCTITKVNGRFFTTFWWCWDSTFYQKNGLQWDDSCPWYVGFLMASLEFLKVSDRVLQW